MAALPAPTRERLGAAAWLLSGGYLVAELLVARASRAPYGLQNTISDLGATSCGPLGDGGRLVCSPGHGWINAAFLLSGLLIAAGALLLHRRIDGGRAATAVLVLTGVSAGAVGLVPIDRSPTLHVAVAAPTFLGRDVAMALLAWRWRRERPPTARWTGVAAALGTAGALLLLATDLPVGLTERLALYPFVAWIAVAGVVWLRRARPGAPRRRSVRRPSSGAIRSP